MVRYEQTTGCLLGGAIGDALGAPYEGLWSESIPDETELLSAFGEFEGYPSGQYTDDTQLTLATIHSIVERGGIEPNRIAQAIADLWRAQTVVGPGGACTQAADRFLATGDWRLCGAQIGQAGNGTAMRTSALGLYFRDDAELVSCVADVSRITHQDPRSIAGGVAIAKATQLLVKPGDLDVDSFCADVANAIVEIHAEFAALVGQLPRLLEEDDVAALNEIAWAGMQTPEFDRPIITPFVIPTVLASLWVTLLHQQSWNQAVAFAIKLGGDVDTLGAIVGGMMGARLGVSAIPGHLVAGVLDSDEIEALAVRYHEIVGEASAS